MSPERKTFIISGINNKDKFLPDFKNCVGLIAVGKSEKNGENISFGLHRDTNYYLDDCKIEEFESSLEKQIKNLKEKVENSSIDVVISGGSFNIGNNNSKDDYIDTIKSVSDIIKQNCGFCPCVIEPNIGKTIMGTGREFGSRNAFLLMMIENCLLKWIRINMNTNRVRKK